MSRKCRLLAANVPINSVFHVTVILPQSYHLTWQEAKSYVDTKSTTAISKVPTLLRSPLQSVTCLRISTCMTNMPDNFKGYSMHWHPSAVRKM
eukprot:scaffold185957_cov19-Prasinocladus_malaysianus.AAC.1